MGYWVNFATRGDPNGPGLPSWPAYDETDVVQILGTTIEARPQSARRSLRLPRQFQGERRASDALAGGGLARYQQYGFSFQTFSCIMSAWQKQK